MTREFEYQFPRMHEAPNDLTVGDIPSRVLTPADLEKARRVVAGASESVTEARELLDMLGLLEESI